MIKRLLRKWLPNPFNRLLQKAKKQGKKRFLIVWNRGMGDVALGLYGLTERILSYIPDAEITYLTRSDLDEACKLLKGVQVIVDPDMVRGSPYQIGSQIDRSQYDIILEKPDPTYWLTDQLGKVTPRLHWPDHLDHIPYEKKKCVGMHVSTETGQYYGYEKNWPKEKWRELIVELTGQGYEVLLFGLRPDSDFEMEGVTDLRGKTSLLEMISLIKNRCSHLVAPDSGVLSLMYYVDKQFPLRLVSLWSDPRQGVLKAGVVSPNAELKHIPLVRDRLSELSSKEVLANVVANSEIG